MYRYGDATPFPLEENFIETIVAAVEATVALFHADVAADARRRRAEAVRQLAEQELARLQVLARSVEASLQPMLPEGKPTKASEVTANKIAASARASIKQAQLGVERRRDVAVRSTMGNELGGQIVDALGEFLLAHQLPKTKWTIRWRYDHASGGTSIELESSTKGCDLRAAYMCELPDTHRWASPVRVCHLEPQLSIELQRETGWLRKHPRMHAESLDKLYIIQAEHSPSKSSFVLRKSYKKPSAGYLVVMRTADHSLPTITKIDSNGQVSDQMLTLSGESSVVLSRLWEHIREPLVAMRAFRSALVRGAFGDVALDRVSEPATLAESILNTLAPIVREMRLRSRVPGELILKRDTGDGKREELFVPRSQLEAKFGTLPDRHARYFEAIGLSSEATSQFVGREFPLAPRTPAAAPTMAPRPMPTMPPPPPMPAVSDKPLFKVKRKGSPPPPPPPRTAPILESADDDSVDEPTRERSDSALPSPPQRRPTVRSLPDLADGDDDERIGFVRLDSEAITETGDFAA